MSRSGEHYMPRPDADFSAWVAQGPGVNDLSSLGDAVGAWNAAYPAHIARWVSPAGERGPWGEQSQATIAA